MAVCYKKLWKMLIDKDMIKKDLRLQTGLSTSTMSKLSKDENVSMDIIEKICTVLNCDVGDIMEFVPDKKRNRKEVRHHGSFLSLYCVFNQRTVPFLRDAFYRKADERRTFR